VNSTTVLQKNCAWEVCDMPQLTTTARIARMPSWYADSSETVEEERYHTAQP